MIYQGWRRVVVVVAGYLRVMLEPDVSGEAEGAAAVPWGTFRGGATACGAQWTSVGGSSVPRGA